MDGAMPIHGVGNAVRSENDSAATIATPAAEMVDLRWVGREAGATGDVSEWSCCCWG